MSIMDYVRNRNVPRIARADLDDQRRLVALEDELRTVPGMERRIDKFAPRADYSIERAHSFLSGHLDEIAMVRATLAVEVAAAEEHLAELKRRVGVTGIIHDALAETLTKLAGKSAEIEAPKDEPAEELPS